MMNKFGILACFMAAFGLLCASLAMAEANRVGGKFGLFGNIGYSSYAMGDTNKAIDNIKAEMSWLNNNMPNYTGSEPSNVYGGLTYSGGMQYAFSDYFALGLEVNVLTINPAKFSYGYNYPVFDPNLGRFYTQNITFSYEGNMTAIEAGPLIKGYLPIGSWLLLNGTVGLEYVSVNGQNKINSPGYEDNITFTGSTLGVKAGIGGEVFLGEGISLGLDLGYRMAKISDFHFSGVDPDRFIFIGGSLDYSGPFCQGGLRLYF